jgi:hypothetical protein
MAWSRSDAEALQTLTFPITVNARTRTIRADSLVADAWTAILLLPNTVHPLTSTRTPLGTITSTSPNGATEVTVTSSGTIAACPEIEVDVAKHGNGHQPSAGGAKPGVLPGVSSWDMD